MLPGFLNSKVFLNTFSGLFSEVKVLKDNFFQHFYTTFIINVLEQEQIKYSSLLSAFFMVSLNFYKLKSITNDHRN